MTDDNTVPTMEEATERARREFEPEHEGRIRFRAKEIIRAAEATARAAERQAELAKVHEREAAEIAKDAVKAWRKLYGRPVAAKLDAAATYWVLRLGGHPRHAWAFADRAKVADAFDVLSAAGLDASIDGERPGLHRARELLAADAGVPGVALTRATDHLDGVDPPVEAIEQIVSETEARRMEERKRRADDAARRRRERREMELFGTTLDGD